MKKAIERLTDLQNKGHKKIRLEILETQYDLNKTEIKKVQKLSEEIKVNRMTWNYVDIQQAIIALKPKPRKATAKKPAEKKPPAAKKTKE